MARVSLLVHLNFGKQLLGMSMTYFQCLHFDFTADVTCILETLWKRESLVHDLIYFAFKILVSRCLFIWYKVSNHGYCTFHIMPHSVTMEYIWKINDCVIPIRSFSLFFETRLDKCYTKVPWSSSVGNVYKNVMLELDF